MKRQFWLKRLARAKSRGLRRIWLLETLREIDAAQSRTDWLTWICISEEAERRVQERDVRWAWEKYGGRG